MTAAVKGWLLSLVAAALITALLDALTPEGIAKKVGRLLGGMLILLVIIRPVFALENTGLARLLEESPLADAQWDRALEEKDKILLEGLITGNYSFNNFFKCFIHLKIYFTFHMPKERFLRSIIQTVTRMRY